MAAIREPIVVRTDRMLLRPLVEGDRAEFLRLHTVSTQHFVPWWPARDPEKTLDEEFDEQLTRTRAEEAAGTGLRRVGMLDDGKMALLANLSQIYRGPFLSCYCGWSVSADQVGRGLATEGVCGLLDAAFAPAPAGLGLHRVQANVVPTNLASLRVAEKCGFRREGLAKDYLKIAGEWKDHVMFAKLTEEHVVRNQVRR